MNYKNISVIKPIERKKFLIITPDGERFSSEYFERIKSKYNDQVEIIYIDTKKKGHDLSYVKEKISGKEFDNVFLDLHGDVHSNGAHRFSWYKDQKSGYVIQELESFTKAHNFFITSCYCGEKSMKKSLEGYGTSANIVHWGSSKRALVTKLGLYEGGQMFSCLNRLKNAKNITKKNIIDNFSNIYTIHFHKYDMNSGVYKYEKIKSFADDSKRRNKFFKWIISKLDKFIYCIKYLVDLVFRSNLVSAHIARERERNEKLLTRYIEESKLEQIKKLIEDNSYLKDCITYDELYFSVTDKNTSEIFKYISQFAKSESFFKNDVDLLYRLLYTKEMLKTFGNLKPLLTELILKQKSLGIDINSKYKKGKTILAWLEEEGKEPHVKEIIKILKEYGATSNKKELDEERHLLKNYVRQSKSKKVKELIERKPYLSEYVTYNTLYNSIVEQNTPEIFNCISESVNKREFFNEKGDYNLLNDLLYKKKCGKIKAPVLEALILKQESLGISINSFDKDGKTLLTLAEKRRAPRKIIELLKKHGAFTRKILDDQISLLTEYVTDSKIEELAKLIEKNTYLKEYVGNYILYKSIIDQKEAKILQYIFQFVKKYDFFNNGEDLLHELLYDKKWDRVSDCVLNELILKQKEFGIDINSKDEDGKTLLFWAEDNKKKYQIPERIFSILKKHGARSDRWLNNFYYLYNNPLTSMYSGNRER